MEGGSIDLYFLLRLGILQLHQIGEGKGHLRLVQDVKQDHVVAAVPQPSESFQDLVGSPSRSLKIITSEWCRSMAAICIRLWRMSV